MLWLFDRWVCTARNEMTGGGGFCFPSGPMKSCSAIDQLIDRDACCEEFVDDVESIAQGCGPECER